MEFAFGTWNVKYNIMVAALQETEWLDHGIPDTK